MFSCNLRFRLIFLHGCSRTHCVASLRAVPVGRISYNLYFDCKHVRSVTCDLINEYTNIYTNNKILLRVAPVSSYYHNNYVLWICQYDNTIIENDGKLDILLHRVAKSAQKRSIYNIHRYLFIGFYGLWSRIRGVVANYLASQVRDPGIDSHQHLKDSWHIWRHLRNDTVFSCNLRCM